MTHRSTSRRRNCSLSISPHVSMQATNRVGRVYKTVRAEDRHKHITYPASIILHRSFNGWAFEFDSLAVYSRRICLFLYNRAGLGLFLKLFLFIHSWYFDFSIYYFFFFFNFFFQRSLRLGLDLDRALLRS